MSLPFKKNNLILFIGDSVTDCNRDRTDPASLGDGYVSKIVERLATDHSELNLRFLNRGISGDRTCDLLARWNIDCIDLKPDWISILIGINNIWRRYDADDPTPDTVFEAECRELLQSVKNETSAGLVLCSPFLLHTDSSIERMREDLDPKIGIFKDLAAEFDAIWVEFDTEFIVATESQSPAYWAFDGVHPSNAGHALMAAAWLRVVGE